MAAFNTLSTGNQTGISSLAIGKVVCVGRNYAAHAAELGNAIPTRPLLFIKPSSSVVSIHDGKIPSVFTDHQRNQTYDVHYETELCIQLGCDLKNANLEEAKKAIRGVALGLDLTLRDLQAELKDKGHPWERAKSFDGACVLADWLSAEMFVNYTNVHYELLINDTVAQHGDTSLMLFSVYDLLVEISHVFSLQAGDVVMTGTPAGVGKLHSGDYLTLKLAKQTWQVGVL